MILLDSSVLIELFRKKNKRNTLFYKLSELEENFSISSVTFYEIGIGNKSSHIEFWNNIYEYLSVLPFDKDCAKTAIDIYLDLRKRNKLIDLADLFIGATALHHNLALSTLKKKHFERIAGLKLQE